MMWCGEWRVERGHNCPIPVVHYYKKDKTDEENNKRPYLPYLKNTYAVFYFIYILISECLCIERERERSLFTKNKKLKSAQEKKKKKQEKKENDPWSFKYIEYLSIVDVI